MTKKHKEPATPAKHHIPLSRISNPNPQYPNIKVPLTDQRRVLHQLKFLHQVPATYLKTYSHGAASKVANFLPSILYPGRQI